MRITESQALNIVRTYNKQLRVGSVGKGDTVAANDTVDLSAEARRLGTGSASEPSAEKPVHGAASSVETQVKSQSDIIVQRNLPFE